MALTHIDYLEGLELLVPKALCGTRTDNDGFLITSWGDLREQPTNQQIEAAYIAQAYARNRKAEYDALNQLELISDDAIKGTTTHKDAILAIKAKYPKG
tara:strand:+ start:114 stop:410 length:297 start_codon:yes stop_codon:yes gene_type:complete